MNKVIKGKRYDTNTAEALGEYQHLYPRDFNYVCETLYRKRTGEFFLFGEGGAASKYRERTTDGMWCGGEKIVPLTLKEAQDWAEEHLDGDEYEKIFGEVDETGEKQTVAMSLDRATIEKAKRMAVEKGISVSELVTQLIGRE